MRVCPKCNNSNPDNYTECFICKIDMDEEEKKQQAAQMQATLATQAAQAAQNAQTAASQARVRIQQALYDGNKGLLLKISEYFKVFAIITFAIGLVIGLVLVFFDFVLGVSVIGGSFLQANVWFALSAGLKWAYETQMINTESLEVLKEIRDKINP